MAEDSFPNETATAENCVPGFGFGSTDSRIGIRNAVTKRGKLSVLCRRRREMSSFEGSRVSVWIVVATVRPDDRALWRRGVDNSRAEMETGVRSISLLSVKKQGGRRARVFVCCWSDFPPALSSCALPREHSPKVGNERVTKMTR